MDHKTYITTFINISNENNEGYDDTTNGHEQWVEDGVATQLMNITTTLQKFETLEANEHEQSNVKYYMEEPRSPIATNANGQT